MTEFDPSKPAMTIAGVPATIICTSKRGEQSIVALVHFKSGDSVISVSENGRASSDQLRTEFDLVNIPESKWMNIYEDPNITICWLDSREAADNASATRGSRRIAITEWTGSGEFITTAVEK